MPQLVDDVRLPRGVARAPLRELLARPPEERVLGPFVLKTLLGKGGFAPVYLAEETYGDVVLRRVALKIFQVRRGATPLPGTIDRARAAVIEEARALCQVEHPNIVRFYAMPTDDALGLVGLAMELLDGRSLDHALTDAAGIPRGLSVSEVLSVGVAIASALSAAHAAGLVHRDVKPANVIDARGTYKLIDFGIAAAERRAPRAKAPTPVVVGDIPIDDAGAFEAALGGVEGSGEAPGSGGAGLVSGEVSISGTAGYIDPRCLAEGLLADATSDLYSLGATLYEALSGYVPAVAYARARGETGLDPAVLYGQAAPPSIGALRPDAPRALLELVDALLAPEREARPRSAEAVARALERVRVELRGHARARPPEETGPFRGLGRFEENDAEVFFGRIGEVASALDLLRSRGLVAVIGASGSGKSSLVRAGVVPALVEGEEGGYRFRRAIVAPGRAPFEAIRSALSEIVPAVAGLQEPDAIVAALATHATHATPEAHATRVARHEGVVLVVDPLEELVTLSEGPSQARAIELLVRLGERPIPGVRTIVALRRDMLDPLIGLDAGLGATLVRGGTLFVDALREETWGEVIDAGLGVYAYRFEDAAMRAEILAELHGSASAMPLVQFALAELWARRDAANKKLPRAALREIGGVVGALRRHAESTVSHLEASHPHALAEVRALLLAMTTPLGTRATRTRKELAENDGPAAGTLDALVGARLVVEDASGLTLAHESLLVEWPRLRAWVDEAREDRVLAETIETAATEWRNAGDPTLLFRGKRLDRARALRAQRSVPLGEDARRFVDESLRARRRDRARFALGGVALLLVASTAAGLWIRQQRAPRQCLAGDVADCSRQCDRGHLGSCNTLGQMLEGGIGVAKDEGRALQVYLRACERDDGLACFSLGRMIDDEKGGAADPARVYLLYRKACDLGAPQGCHAVGVKLSDLERSAEVAGDLAKRDARRREIAALFSRGCDGGFVRACTSLAIMLDQGDLGPGERARAPELYARACARGEPAACALKDGLGRSGQLDRADPEQLRRACLSGYGYACNVLGLVLEPKPRREEAEGASAAYQRGCNLKEGDACANLGRLFESGRLPSTDGLRAYGLYARGCELGSAVACRARARLQARGVPADHAGARKLLSSQCDVAGDLDACVELAALAAADEEASEAKRRREQACAPGLGAACTPLPAESAPSAASSAVAASPGASTLPPRPATTTAPPPPPSPTASKPQCRTLEECMTAN